MARRALPPEVKKKSLKVYLDPDLYELAKAQFPKMSAGAWVNEACREKAARDAKKKTAKKGTR